MRNRDLRLLILHVATRCDQTCGHCAIWRPEASAPREALWGAPERLRLLEEARAAGASTVLFTGGEPLLCDHIQLLVRRAKALGLVVQIATNGLGLERAAGWIAACVDGVFVSLEGSEDVHDRVRGPGMMSRLRRGVDALRGFGRRPRMVARCTLTALNAARIETTVSAARDMGFDAVSFLPVDTSSEAFGARPSERAAWRPSSVDIAELRRGILFLSAAGELGDFVVESEEKLMSLADALEGADAAPPRCNAPEWSVVVEADGASRPCFFQPVVVAAEGESPIRVRDTAAWSSALSMLGAGNPTCRTCVCPKFIETEAPSLARRAGRAARRALPSWLTEAGAA